MAGTGKMQSVGQERHMEKFSLSHSNVQVLLMSVLIYAVHTANILNSNTGRSVVTCVHPELLIVVTHKSRWQQ